MNFQAHHRKTLLHLHNIVYFSHKQSVKHITISNKRSLYYLGKTGFSSVYDLVEHYKTHDVPNKEKVVGVRLTQPVTNYVLPDYENAEVFAENHRNPDQSSWDIPDSGSAPNQHPPCAEMTEAIPRIVAPRTKERMVKTPQSSPTLTDWNRHSSPEVSPGPSAISSRMPLAVSPTKTNHLSPRSPKSPRSPSPTGRRNIRPPPPIPHELFPYDVQREIEKVRESPEYSMRPYATVRDVCVDRASALINQLKLTEKCECGLFVNEAQLPLGWTVHLVMDADKKADTPKVFYVTPENESSWMLPNDVKQMLNPDQRAFLERLRAHGRPKGR